MCHRLRMAPIYGAVITARSARTGENMRKHRNKGPLANIFTGLRVIVQLGGKLSSTVTTVTERLSDGTVSVDEGESFGRAVAVDSGDWRVRVNGVDIIDDETQAEIGGIAGRLAVNLFRALTP